MTGWRESCDLPALMDRAVEIAGAADSRVYPNPRVGAVFWKDGRIVGEGRHDCCGGPHAEVAAALAADAAGEDLAGSTAVVTLEPCSHHGRTPPCTDLLIRRGVARVVYGLPDPNPRVDGIGKLRAAGIEVVGPLVRPGLLALAEPFCKNLLHRRAYLIQKWAMTLDGRFATAGGDSAWVSGEESRRDAHGLRTRVDAVLVGTGTFLIDRPDLGVRLGAIGPCPRPAVWDPRGRTAAEPAWWTERLGRRPLVLTTPDTAQAARWPEGVRVLAVPDLRDLDALLFAEGIHAALVEGGAGLHGLLRDSGLGDAVRVYIAPTILGGRDALGPVGGTGTALMSGATRLLDSRVSRTGADLRVDGLLLCHHPQAAALLGIDPPARPPFEKEGRAE